MTIPPTAIALARTSRQCCACSVMLAAAVKHAFALASGVAFIAVPKSSSAPSAQSVSDSIR